MKKFLATLLLLVALVIGGSLVATAFADTDSAAAVSIKIDGGVVTPAPPPGTPTEPENVSGAIDVGKGAVAAAKDGRWWYFSALVVTLILFLLKFVGIKVGFWPKMGRWRYVIPPVLSLAAALLAAFQGGVSMDAAVGVFTSAYATSSLQELLEHGILGKPRASAGG